MRKYIGKTFFEKKKFSHTLSKKLLIYGVKVFEGDLKEKLFSKSCSLTTIPCEGKKLK